MAEVTEGKDGKVILECDCGIIHKLKWNDDAKEIELKSSIKAPKQKEEEIGTAQKRNSIFGNKDGK